MRTSIKTILLAPALVLAAACSKDKPVDASLTNDLTLAAQARQTTMMDSISAVERNNAAVAANASALRAAPAPAASAPRRTATTTRRRSTSSGSSSSGSSNSGTVAAREPRTITEKNTKRDAAIGAAAGAIIGATTSRDKVKGGLIGAAAGGILGAVIGNNVDIKKRTVP